MARLLETRRLPTGLGELVAIVFEELNAADSRSDDDSKAILCRASKQQCM